MYNSAMSCCGSASQSAYNLLLTASDGALIDRGQQKEPLERVLKRIGVEFFNKQQYGHFAVSTTHTGGQDTHGYIIVSPRGFDRRQ